MQNVSRDGAYALVTGALLTMLLFAFHPSHVTQQAVLGPFTLSQLVHGTAFVAVPLLLLGMWQMAVWTGLGRTSVRLGLLLGALAMALTANAAIISNFVTPAAAAAHRNTPSGAVRVQRSDASSLAAGQRHAGAVPSHAMPSLVRTSVAMNRGFAQIHVTYLSLAILFFGIALFSTNRSLAVTGILVGAFPVLWQLSGTFVPQTRTMPWVVYPQSLWLISVAVAMLRDSEGGAGA